VAWTVGIAFGALVAGLGFQVYRWWTYVPPLGCASGMVGNQGDPRLGCVPGDPSRIPIGGSFVSMTVSRPMP